MSLLLIHIFWKSICDNLFDLQRSSELPRKRWQHSHNRVTKTASTSFSLSNYSQKLPFFAVLMYSLYCHPRYFKFKRKYQQYDPCFPTIFPFLMIMYLYIYFFQSIIRDKTRSFWSRFFPDQIRTDSLMKAFRSSHRRYSMK